MTVTQDNAATGTLRFAVLTDIHLSSPGASDSRGQNIMRRSVSADLLDAALAAIVAAGHDRVLLLGDIADRGTPDMIATVLRRISAAGLSPWAVPGNHDVIVASDSLARAAAESATGGCVLSAGPQRPGSGISLVGVGLASDDGGRNCHASPLPDTAPLDGRLLVWASHYPLLSLRDRLQAAGLLCTDDLVNLAEARAAAECFDGPVLVLHGHLHTAVVRQAGRLWQMGCPAVVDWPHAWTDVAIDVTADAVTVRTELNPIPGQWSVRQVDTILSGPRQAWTFSAGQWHDAS